MKRLRIGVNALYLIPGRVGGTEIYLRGLLGALAETDAVNRYFVFTNRETGRDLTPAAENFTEVRQPVRASSRPARILWEQTALPLWAAGLRLDAMLNPGFTAPLLAGCPQVTVFHDLQHLRHPEYFRWFDLPFWKFFLYWSAMVSRAVVASSEATASDLIEFYRLPASKVRVARLGGGRGGRGWEWPRCSSSWPSAGSRSRSCWPYRRCIRTRTWTGCCAPSRNSGGSGPTSRWWGAGCPAFSPARCTSHAPPRA